MCCSIATLHRLPNWGSGKQHSHIVSRFLLAKMGICPKLPITRYISIKESAAFHDG